MKFTGERYLPNSQDKTMEVEHRQRYVSIIPLVEDKVVIDAACGEGYGTDMLSNYAKEVIGVDISKEAITHAKGTYMKSNIRFIMSSVEKMDIPSHSADVFVSFETIEHIDSEMQHLFLREIKRVLKEDGILIMSTPDKHRYSVLRNYSNPFHVKEFYKQEFYDFLKGYFCNIEFYYQRFEIVSLVSNEKSNLVQYVEVEDKVQENEGMYIVAVCSNGQKSHNSIDSYTLSTGFKYNQLTERIICLQDEVEERNAHIRKLDEEIDQTNAIIVNLQNEVEQRNNHLSSLDKTIEDNEILIFDLQIELEKEKKYTYECEIFIKDLQVILNNKDIKLNEVESEYTNVIHNQKAHINLLLEEERKLDAIYQSGGWKLLKRYYQIRDFVIPKDSKRRFIVKMLVRTLRNPKDTIRHINKENIKKFRRYLQTDNIGMLKNRVENYLERHTTTNGQREITLMNHVDSSKELHFQTVDVPIVSIIIPVYNQWEYTYSCLVSILEHTTDVPYEIIIADDVSTDDTVHIKNIVQNITVVRDEINRGFLLNCNNAAKQARGKYIFFLNNDTNVQGEWLSSLVDLIESDNQIGMVGSKLVYPDGRLQEAGGIIWSDASGWNYGRLDDPNKSEYNYVKDVDYISGAAIMIRKELWERIGGFDERYVPAYYEDVDLAFTVRNLGYKVKLQPKSIVVHFEGISHGTNVESGIKNHQIINQKKFKKKWETELLQQHFDNGEKVIFARDRSNSKKTIIMVDHYVPHYDKDAGSRCVDHYLHLFVEMGYHVIFIGDNFFKHEPYTTRLENLGIQVLYGSWYSNHIVDWVKQNADYMDYIYLCRPHIAEKYMDLFKKHTTAKIVYFTVDLHYLRMQRNYEIDKNPELLKSSDYWKNIEFDLIAKANTVHVVGSYEENILKKQFPNKDIRNIPIYFYDTVEKDVNCFENRNHLLFVGGFGHKPNVDGILWFISELFPKIVEHIPDIKLFIVGSNPTPEIKNLHSENVIVTGFVSDEELMRYYESSRVVVAPLRFGAGVKGKVVEAIANQIPLVTTSIGAEGLTDLDKVIPVFDDESNFIVSILDLYSNKEKWEQVSQQCGLYVHQYFTKETAKKIIEMDFEVKCNKVKNL